ncbi:murein biosynthesis integral membrane protein MurJ [Amnibacterium setariae]|uniref:Murein biosynthesis integral membrane protein MurJ n=1 Tax=Amnibacterium setariae TaxID=2306585 RepID=A0A3A1U161_9MICO|nr:murein biosynthesis integral membrane protein MurJ [Amnibacterium setariae]RIX30093.1 murein biosynthesis integral membrane protein MurJ [Amnibacterium setariae]
MSSGVGRASALLASGTIVSRVLGFTRTIVLTGVLSGQTTIVGNALTNATQMPTSLYALIGGGLVSAVLVPQTIRASRGADGGVAYVNKLLTIAIVAIGLLTVVLTIAAPLLMHLTISDRRTYEVAVPFAFWSMPQIFFLGMYAVLGEVLNARRRFGAYTWAPVANNVIAVAVLAIFLVLFGSVSKFRSTPLDPAQTAVLAGGTTAGIAVQALVLALVWKRAGLSFRPDFHWRGVGLRATGQAAGWTFGMLVLTQAAGFLQGYVATGASGPTTPSTFALANSWLLFMLPHSIITVSLATVFYPRMSEHAAEGDLPALRDDLSTVLRTVLLVIGLATAVLLAAAAPVTAIFSGTKDLSTAAEAHAVAPVLVAYVLGLIPFTVLYVVQRCFYALADTRTPFRFTLVQLVVVVPGILACTLLPHAWTAVGIAAVISIGGTVQLVVALALLRRRLGPLGDRHLAAGLRRIALAGVPALAAGVLVLWATGGLADGWSVSSTIGGAVGALLIAVVCAAVYAIVLALLRAPEIRMATDLVRSRLRR